MSSNKIKIIKTIAEERNWKEIYSISKNFLNLLNITKKQSLEILLSIEEIFVNISKYAYPEKTGKVLIKIFYDKNKNELAIFFQDEGVAFDPTVKKDPFIHCTLENREIGGLGIYMVKNFMDSMTYKYLENKNCLQLTKKIQ